MACRALRIRWTGLLMVFSILLASVSAAAAAEVYLESVKGKTERIPLVISGLRINPGLDAQGRTLRGVFEADIRRSYVFNLLNAGRLGEKEAASLPDPDRVKRFGGRGASAVVWMNLTKERNDLVLEAYAFDGIGGQRVLGKRYRTGVEYARTLAHRFTDDLVLQFTGDRGIAQSRIAFVSDKTRFKEIYVMDYDGYNPRAITGDRSINLSPRWTPDGKWLAYTSYKDANPNLYVLDLMTSRRWRMASFPGINISPSWSPDGDWLAFTSSKDGNPDVYAIRRDGSGLRRLTFDSDVDVSPSWAPTGRQIVFTSDRGGSPQLYVMNADGSDARRLTFEGENNSSPNWSPRGNWIAFTCRRGGRFHICLITPDGSKAVQLTDGGYDDESPSWAVDGRHLVFSSNRDGKKNLYIMNEDGLEQERLTFNGANNTYPSWSP